MPITVKTMTLINGRIWKRKGNQLKSKYGEKAVLEAYFHGKGNNKHLLEQAKIIKKFKNQYHLKEVI